MRAGESRSARVVQRCSLWGAAGVVVPLLVFADAHAQTERGAEVVDDARATYDAGARAFAERLFPDAARAFERAASLVPNAVALLAGGLAWERAGEPALAADDYSRVVGLPGGLTERQSRRARERLAVLEPELGTVRVTGAAGDEVQFDDHVPAIPVPVTLHAAAGAHVLVVTHAKDASGVRPLPERRSLTIVAGTAIDLPLPSHAQAAVAPVSSADITDFRQSRPPEDGPARRTPRTVGFVLLGAGVASEVGAAALWWGGAIGAKHDYILHRTLDNRNRAASFETWTNVALLGGGALAAAGATCWIWSSLSREHASPNRPHVSVAVEFRPTAFLLRGQW